MIEPCPRLFPTFARFVVVFQLVSISSKVHSINTEVSDLGATLCPTCKTPVFTRTTTAAH